MIEVQLEVQPCALSGRHPCHLGMAASSPWCSFEAVQRRAETTLKTILELDKYFMD